ncbi:Sorting nexin-30 [Mortierella alpina]|nr:Sorting nexin-30 [Mortierella alpina]
MMNRPNRGPGVHSNNNSNSSNLNSSNMNNNSPMTRDRPINPMHTSTGVNGMPTIAIADLRPNMRGFNLECILLEKAGESRRAPTDDQLITTFHAADKSGSIILTIWGAESQLLRSGDLVRLLGGEAKLFKGHIQLSTTKSGKYKKFGEDTIPFTDKPNWSEFDWVQDPSKPSQMVPLTPQLKMTMSANGMQPIPAVANMQQQRHNQQAVINPAFQRQNQRSGNMSGSIPGQRQGQGPGGFSNNNSNNKSNFGGGVGQQQHHQHGAGSLGMNGPLPAGPNSGVPGQRPHQANSNQMPNQSQNLNHQNLNLNQGQGHIQSQGQVQGQGPTQGQGPAQGQGPMQGQAQGQGQGPLQGQAQGQGQGHGLMNNAGQGSAHPSLPLPPNARPKFNKKHQHHRDLDAPDSYPSPRTGLANSADEFAREMKFVAQGGTGGPGHIRKKTRTEMD